MTLGDNFDDLIICDDAVLVAKPEKVGSPCAGRAPMSRTVRPAPAASRALRPNPVGPRLCHSRVFTLPVQIASKGAFSRPVLSHMLHGVSNAMGGRARRGSKGYDPVAESRTQMRCDKEGADLEITVMNHPKLSGVIVSQLGLEGSACAGMAGPTLAHSRRAHSRSSSLAHSRPSSLAHSLEQPWPTAHAPRQVRVRSQRGRPHLRSPGRAGQDASGGKRGPSIRLPAPTAPLSHLRARSLLCLRPSVSPTGPRARSASQWWARPRRCVRACIGDEPCPSLSDRASRPWLTPCLPPQIILDKNFADPGVTVVK